MQRKIKMSLQRHKRRNLRQHPPDKLSQNTTEIPFEDWRLLQTKPHIISMDTSLELGRIRQTSNSGAFTEAAELGRVQMFCKKKKLRCNLANLKY